MSGEYILSDICDFLLLVGCFIYLALGKQDYEAY